MLLFGALCLFAVSCGDGDRPTVTGGPPATARPAPTIAAEIVPQQETAVQVQAVVVGVDADSLIQVHSQPGLNFPLMGEVRAGSVIEPLGQVVITEDDLVWWWVQAADVQGWTAARIAYRAPAQVMSFDGDVTHASPAAAAAAITSQLSASRGPAEAVTVSTNEYEDRNSVLITSDLVFDDGPIAGVRLIIAVAPTGASAEQWRLIALTQFELCTNGINAAGTCL